MDYKIGLESVSILDEVESDGMFWIVVLEIIDWWGDVEVGWIGDMIWEFVIVIVVVFIFILLLDYFFEKFIFWVWESDLLFFSLWKIDCFFGFLKFGWKYCIWELELVME